MTFLGDCHNHQIPGLYFKDNICDRFLDCQQQKLTLAKLKKKAIRRISGANRINKKIMWEDQSWEMAGSKAFLEEPISRKHIYCPPPPPLTGM